MKWFTVFYSIVATGSMLETLRFAASYPFYVWALRAQAKVRYGYTVPGTAVPTLLSTAYYIIHTQDVSIRVHNVYIHLSAECFLF